MTALGVPKVPAAINELTPTISAYEMYKTLETYHNSLSPEDKTKYIPPDKPSGQVLANSTLRRAPANGTNLTEGEIGVEITNNSYERRSDPMTGRFSRSENSLGTTPTATTSEEVKIKVFQKGSGWGEGEKSYAITTSRQNLPAEIAKVEKEIASGKVAENFTEVIQKNAETGRLESVPIKK